MRSRPGSGGSATTRAGSGSSAPSRGSGQLIADARYATAVPGERTADFAVTVADEWQGRGVGTRLAKRLIEAARANGMTRLTAMTLWENEAAIALLHRLGFLRTGYDGDAIEYELAL